MDQRQVERWIADNGGKSAVQYTSEKRRVTNPAFAMSLPDGNPNPQYQPGQPPTVEVVSEMWVNSKTGAKLHVSRKDDESFDVIENTGGDPNKPGSSAPAKPAGETKEIGGRLKEFNPATGLFDIDHGSTTAPATRTPEQTRSDAANASTAEENARNAAGLNAERDWHERAGHGRLTHADYETKLDKDKAAALAEGNQAEGNRIARERFAWDKEKASLPAVTAEATPVNGVRYTTITTTPRDGRPPTITYLGPDGKPVSALPSEGAASVGGPPMPEIVVGVSQDALRRYHEALWKDPSLTPAQREKRFQEAVQTANIAVQEAATQQRERESARNADYNTASTKLNFMESGLKTALSFVSELNGKLDAGSDLGGRAFAALLGLQMIQMDRSGINNLPSLSSRDMNDSARLETARSQITTQLAPQPVARPPVDATPPAAPAIVDPASIGAPEAPTGGAVPSGAPGVLPPPVPMPQLAPQAPHLGQPVPAPGAPPTAAASPAPPPTPTGDTITLHHPGTGETWTISRQEHDARKGTLRMAGWVEQAPGAVPAAPPPPSAALSPPVSMAPPAADPSAGGGQYQQWPALAGYGPAPAPVAPPSPAVTAESPAMLAVRARSTVPWRISEEEAQQYLAAGISMDDLLSIPGRTA